MVFIYFIGTLISVIYVNDCGFDREISVILFPLWFISCGNMSVCVFILLNKFFPHFFFLFPLFCCLFPNFFYAYTIGNSYNVRSLYYSISYWKAITSVFYQYSVFWWCIEYTRTPKFMYMPAHPWLVVYKAAIILNYPLYLERIRKLQTINSSLFVCDKINSFSFV